MTTFLDYFNALQDFLLLTANSHVTKLQPFDDQPLTSKSESQIV